MVSESRGRLVHRPIPHWPSGHWNGSRRGAHWSRRRGRGWSGQARKAWP